MNTSPDNQAASSPTPVGETQKQRWFKYGLNVTVMVLAVIAIVVFINIIAYRSVRRSPWLRSDWTSTRQYSLSPQTLGLLGALDKDVTVTTFYVKSDLASAQVTEQLQRVEDLLAEYQRRSGRVAVEQIDPAVDIEDREAFFEKLLTRYADQVDTSRSALEKSKGMFEKVKTFSEGQTRALPEKVAQIGNADTQTTLLLRQLNQQFVLAGQLIEDIQAQVDRSLDQSLPDFSSARRAAESQLDQFQNFTNLALERFTAKTDDKNTPKVVTEALLDLGKDYKALRDELATALGQLKDASSSDYDQMRSRLQQNNSMIVGLKTPAAGGKDRGITVLTMDDIYPLQAGAQPGEGIQGYKGEEAITGAILKLTLTHKTHVVFVNPTQQPLLQQSRSERGSQSTYNNVAGRLRSMNFKVSEWRPGPQMGPRGQPMPPQPKPVAEAGETLIFVAVAEQQNPFANPRGPNPGQMVESAVSEHLKQGQPTLVFTAPKFNPGFGATP
ncbi:MAG: Gldg family protein, partial [Phycisphaerae bacterium]|nr:Gldg family protein [Phycisphaerae bacterium]